MGTAKTVLGYFFLLQTFFTVESQECNLCMGGLDAIPDAYLMRPALNGKTCQKLGFEAMYYNANDDNCLQHYHFVGYTVCGCEPPPSPPTRSCSLCMDGRAPPDLHSFFDDDLRTCGYINKFLQLFPQNPETCNSFHVRGIEKCGCPDLLPQSDSTPQNDSTFLFSEPTSRSPSSDSASQSDSTFSFSEPISTSPSRQSSPTSDPPSSSPVLLPSKRKSRKKSGTTEFSSYHDSLVLVLGVGSMVVIFTFFYCITKNRTFDEKDTGGMNKVDIASDTSSDKLSNEETLMYKDIESIPAAILLPVNFKASQHELSAEESSTDSFDPIPSELEKCFNPSEFEKCFKLESSRSASSSKSRTHKKTPYSQYFD